MRVSPDEFWIPQKIANDVGNASMYELYYEIVLC